MPTPSITRVTDGELRAVLDSLSGDIRRVRHHHPRADHEPPIPHHVVTTTLSHITHRVRTAPPSQFPVNPQLCAAVDPAGPWEYEQLRVVTTAAVVAAACAVNDAVGLLEALCSWKPAVPPTLSRARNAHERGRQHWR